MRVCGQRRKCSEPAVGENLGLLIFQTAIFASVYKTYTKNFLHFPCFFPPEINFLRAYARKIAGFWMWVFKTVQLCLKTFKNKQVAIFLVLRHVQLFVLFLILQIRIH